MAKGLNKSTAQIEAKIGFQADVSQAKKAIAELQNSLQKLATQSHVGNWTKEMQEAQNAAAELAVHLKDATNVNTGKIDFSKLNQSVKQSGKTVAQYGDELLKLGPAGQQSFQQLTKAIANSEIPVRRISKSVQELGNVLKNTIRWQISSSALHAFMGAIQSAYGYAQDLNESLNQIRIVTGQNIDQMDRFADRANKAAQALSTSTLEYTKASLIYYQQGLSDEEVQARTDVTVKMANVTGNTAEKVSQQLTAVWNNYAKGAENLEYFADVMTALGAATASSSDEISQGLEKFAAIGQTVGLSYEYAAAALATVTATTRQSADVVGNAFKTLFARLEGLSLGKTEDDGTDLNKYSKALMAVGINIKDVNGDMKDMDTILDELASKWNVLGQDQQMALAQTVAGVRQYTQLIALMNNWDFMQQNVKTAKDSMGTLQKQQDIYAESWEAARDRVQAALQSIYQKLIDDDFFIKLLNALEKVIGFVDNLIDGLGGLPGLLSLISTIALQAFGPQIQEGLRNMVYSAQMLTKSGRDKASAARTSTLQEMTEAIRLNGIDSDDATNASNTQADLFEQEADSLTTMAQQSDKLTQSQKSLFNLTLQRLEANKEELIEEAKKLDILSSEVDEAKVKLDYIKNINLEQQRLNAESSLSSGVSLDSNNLPTQVITYFNAIEEKLRGMGLSVSEFWQELGGKDNFVLTEQNLNAVTKHFQTVTDIELKDVEHGYNDLVQKQEKATNKLRENTDKVTEGHKKLREEIEQSSHSTVDWAGKITKGAQAITTLINVGNTVSGLIDNLSDKSKSFGDKVSSGIGTLASLAVSSIMGIKAAIDVLGASGGVIFALLSIAIGVYTAIVKWQEKTRQAALEEAEATEKASATKLKALQEEKESADKLAKSYAELYALQDNTISGKEALKEAALKAVEAYNIENGYLLIAQENYKQLAIEIAEARRQKALYNAELAGQNLTDQAKVVAQKLENSNRDLSRTNNGLELYIGHDDDQEWAKRAQELGLTTRVTEGNGLYVYLEETAQGLTDGLEALTTFYGYLDSVGASNEAAKVEGIVNSSKSEIDTLQEGIAQAAQNEIENLVQASLSKENYNVSSLSDYIELEDSVFQQASQLGYQIALSDIRSSFSANGQQHFASQSAWLREFSASSGIGLTDLGRLSSEQLQTMLSINPGAIQGNFDKLLELIEQFGAIGRYSTAQTSAAKYTAAAGAMKEGQTQAEIDAALAEAGLTLGEEERQEFYRKTYEERVAWLEEMARAEVDSAKESGKEIQELNIAELERQKAELEQQQADAMEKKKYSATAQLTYNAYQSQIDDIQAAIDAINEQQAQAQTDSIFRAQELAKVYDSILTSDVDIGDKVSADFAEKLSAIGVDISKYLVPNDDGTYSLVISGAEFREEAFNQLVNAFSGLNEEEKIQSEKVILDNITSYTQLKKVTDAQIISESKLIGVRQKLRKVLSTKDLNTDEIEKYADYLQEIAGEANELWDKLNGHAKAAEVVATSIMNMNDGYEALSSNWATWKAQLNEGESGEDYYTALDNVKEAIADLLDVNTDQISYDFAQQMLGNVEEVANGNLSKIDDIRNAYIESIKTQLAGTLTGVTTDELSSFIDGMRDWLSNNELEVGEVLDVTSFYEKLSELDSSWIATLDAMLANGAAGFDAIQGIAEALNLEIELEPIYGKLSVPNFKDIAEYAGDTKAEKLNNFLKSNTTDVDTVTGWTIKSVTQKARRPTFNPTTKSTGGGGSSKKANKEVSQKTEADRYHYIREQLSDLERAYAAAGKAKDKAFGDEQLRYIDQEIELTDQLIDKQDEYLAEINDYMEKAQGDRDALLASGFVTEADLDDNGLIKNWDAIWRAINKAREDAVNDYNRDKDNESIDAEGNYKAATEKIDEAERRLKQYEDTLNLWEQEQEKRVDLLRQKQELAFERTSYILDTNLKLTENDIKAINFQYDLLKDNLYKAVEAMQLLVGANYDAFNSGEMHKYLNELGYVKDNYEDLVSLWNQDIGFDTNGNVLHAISQADFIDGLQNNIDTIYDKLKEILNLDKEMFEYYANTLAKSNEEIARYRDQMDAISSAMQHWKSILDLTSKTHKDYYKQLDAILKGQRDMAGNDYAVSKQRYEDLLEEQKHAEEALAGATGERERELLQHNLDAINEQVRDAWEKMLSDAENYAQKARDVLVNALEMAADEAEDILTHGMGFDQLNDSMDRISSNQDEYLTKTNQLYEMNQMLRQLQQDSDKANNQAAKTRIANFTKEMEDLRDKNQLSKLDLDIAKARYEVLLAEIALEDAQNAKSVVRLQRDNEGNFGYVYTADRDNVAKAQDDLAKKQNDLYNIVLNGTNDYGQKMIQLNQQYLEKLKEINEKYTEENGFTEQERQAAILQATEEFNRLRQTYEEQYTTAMYWLNETASTDTSEAWVNAYQDIIENGQEWHDATTTYLQQVDEALDEYQSVTDVVTQEVGEDYDETKQKVDDLTEAHDQLADKLENEVLTAVQEVESAVQEATETYAANRDRVYEMVAAYQALIREMQSYQQLAAMENFDAASDDYDSSVDYSKLMAEAFKAGHTAEVQKYAQYRDRKTGELGLSDADLAGKGWQTTKDILAALNDQNMSYDEKLDWLRKHLYLPGFGTGGYTGEWGSTGRLALLHEKELVLNQEDTENLLNAVSIVRGISSFIEGQARAAAGSVGFSIPGLSGGGSFEQTVTIRAEFPNVTDHNEILEAFNNLRNMATQYANRY